MNFADQRKSVLNRVLEFLYVTQYSSLSNIEISCLAFGWTKTEEEKLKLQKIIYDGYIEKYNHPSSYNVFYTLSIKGKRTLLSRKSLRDMWLKHVYPQYRNKTLKQIKRALILGL